MNSSPPLTRGRSTSVSVSSSTDSGPDGSHDTSPQHPCVRLASASLDCGRYSLHTMGKQGVFFISDDGYMGGSWYTDPGSGANYLCLPPNPAGGIIAKPASYSHLGGTEYEVSNRLENNQDALCAVCFVKNRSSNIMIPGTNSCPSGWTTEYTGLLMTGNNAHAGSSEFICVDSKLEGRIDSNADRDGRLLLLVASFCGSLPCPPYQNNNILQCVVCSK
ncbi:hypothetical protein C0Q70_20166 [Pomacea canaliculata]|uniref:Short-chain collagen C4 n=1 Tax=Pomacea canaliculata TaxID=400727 RepID=A0A2T7NET4_POMCA|nr:hypothetical protein C0Q70_20166 [Pomacea canaliculata]